MWLMGGARLGFYVISEELSFVEPVTEIESSTTHPKFLPGIETLFAGLILVGSFWAMSFLFSKPIVK
jgi:hypothetical protein